MKPTLNFSLINIDKPAGPTSFAVSEYIKKQLNLNKTSHMGTLDPKVTGVLPITLGRACKLAGYFITHDKGYIGILHTHKPQKIKELQEVINNNFLGKIIQIPPHKSAVKRVKREREIYKFELLEFSKDKKDFLFHCKVEGGTYVRKLCSDLGELIGGAHMAELRRTAAGIFSEDKIFTLNEFSEAFKEYEKGEEKKLMKMLTSAEEAIKRVLPVIQVRKQAIKALYTGKPLFERDLAKEHLRLNEGDKFAVFCTKNFIGIYKRAKKSPIFGKAEFVYN